MLDLTPRPTRMQQLASHADDARYPQMRPGLTLRLIGPADEGWPSLACLLYHSSRAMIRTTHSSSRTATCSWAFWCPEAFLDDLAAARLADRVVVLLFSGVRRTVSGENGRPAPTRHFRPRLSRRPNVNGGSWDGTACLDLDPKYGDLKTTLDFRRIYATVLEDWLGLPAKAALGGDFQKAASFPAPDERGQSSGMQLPTVPSELVCHLRSRTQ